MVHWVVDHSYWSGELLLDQQRFEEAVEKFDKAIELEKVKYVFNILPMSPQESFSTQLYRSPPNVLSLVNKGLALFQWKQESSGTFFKILLSIVLYLSICRHLSMLAVQLPPRLTAREDVGI